MDKLYTIPKEIKNIILEVELKSIFTNLLNGTRIAMQLGDKSRESFDIESNSAGNIIMKNVRTHILYLMTKDSIVDGTLTLFQYDSSKPNFQGAKIKLKVDEIITSLKQGGKIISIDTTEQEVEIDPEIQNAVDNMNSELKTVGEGDTIIITTAVADNDELSNNLFFKVTKITNSFIAMKFYDVDADDKIGKDLFINFNHHKLYISNDSLVDIDENGDTFLDILTSKKKSMQLKNIVAIEVNKANDEILDDADEDGEDGDKKFSKKELEDILTNEPIYQDMINKQPGILAALAGASPRGVYQLLKKVKSHVVNNSYLKVGAKPKFIYYGPSIYVDGKHNITNKATYYGTVINGQIIKLGDIGKGHWEFSLSNETEPSTYEVISKYYNSNRNLTKKDKATIKIIDITNG